MTSALEVVGISGAASVLMAKTTMTTTRGKFSERMKISRSPHSGLYVLMETRLDIVFASQTSSSFICESMKASILEKLPGVHFTRNQKPGESSGPQLSYTCDPQLPSDDHSAVGGCVCSAACPQCEARPGLGAFRFFFVPKCRIPQIYCIWDSRFFPHDVALPDNRRLAHPQPQRSACPVRKRVGPGQPSST